MNINFCGTGMEATRSSLASVQAINAFENRLLLSGVGAPDAYDPVTQEHYPTPGTFDVNNELKRKPREYWFNESITVLQRGAGFAWGAGEQDNLALAMAHIKRKMSTVNSQEAVHINLSGYSRGAASAIYLANRIYKHYGTRIKVNLFLIDPNAGPGRQFDQQKRNIPPIVEQMYVVFNRDETLRPFQSLNTPHYLLSSSKTALSVLHVGGTHLEQEQLPSDNTSGSRSSAECNQQLLELFYESYGARRLNGESASVLFKKDDKVKKGFVSVNTKQTVIDQAIDALDAMDNRQETPLRLQKNKYLKQFNQEISGLHNRHYSELSYLFSQLLSEMDRMSLDTPQKIQKVDALRASTNQLIQAMTPSHARSNREKRAVLDQFKHDFALSGVTEVIKQIVAHIIGIVLGTFAGVMLGTCGFFMGLTRVKTLGLASIPYATAGLYNGFVAGMEIGKKEMLGPQNARQIWKTVDRISTEESLPVMLLP